MTNEPRDDEFRQRLAGALSGLPVDPRALGRINTGFRRRRNLRWGGAATALATAGIVAFAVIATPGGNDRQTILPPVGGTRPITTETPTATTDQDFYPLVLGRPTGAGGSPGAQQVGALGLMSARTGELVRVIALAPSSGSYFKPIIGPSGQFVYTYIVPRDQSLAVSLVRIPISGGTAMTLPFNGPAGYNLNVGNDMSPSTDDHDVILYAGKLIATGGANQIVVVQSISGGPARPLSIPMTGRVAGVAGWLPDGHTLITYDDDFDGVPSAQKKTVLSRYDLATDTKIRIAEFDANPGVCLRATVAADGNVAITNADANCNSETISYVDPKTGSITAGIELPTWLYHDAFTTPITTFQFVPSGALTVGVCYTQAVLVRGGTITTLNRGTPTC